MGDHQGIILDVGGNATATATANINISSAFLPPTPQPPPTPPPQCPHYLDEDFILLEEVSFWMEGVTQTSIAVLGILFNVCSR